MPRPASFAEISAFARLRPIMGASSKPEERMVRAGKIVTAAGVSAGVDLALWLASEIAGQGRAEAIQLVIEYDPHPAFDAGHIGKASGQVRKLAKEMLDQRMPADQRRLVPKIARRRMVDLVRTGRRGASDPGISSERGGDRPIRWENFRAPVAGDR